MPIVVVVTDALTSPTICLDSNDRERLLLTWATGASDRDEFFLCESLVSQSEADAADVASWRARDAAILGDAHRALDLLRPTGAADRPNGPPTTPDDVTVLAARALRGDGDALAHMIRSGGRVPGLSRGAYLYLLAVASERAGRPDLGLDAWLTLADSGAGTPLVLGRAAAGLVHRRSRTGSASDGSDVFRAAMLLRSAWPAPWDDAAALEYATSVLTAASDPAGAALLVEAVRRTSPPGVAIERVAAAHRPRVRRWARALPFLVMVPALMGGLLPAVAVGAFAVPALRRTIQGIPSWTPGDEELYFALRTMSHDVSRGRTRSTDIRVLNVVGAIVGLAVGVWFAAVVTGAIEAMTVGWEVLVWTVATLGGLAGGALLGVPAHRRLDHGKLMRELAVEDDRRRTTMSTCRCLDMHVLVGRTADGYVLGHLRPLDAIGLVAVGQPFSVLLCELTGARWLAVRTTSGVSTLLLRGEPASSAVPVDSTSTGLYL